MMKNMQLLNRFILMGFCAAMVVGYSQPALAQIKTSVSFTNPYAQHLSDAQQTHKEAKAYKRLMKDSLRNLRRINKLYDAKIDSAFEVARAQAGIDDELIPDREQLKDFKKDSSRYSDLLEDQYKLYEREYLNLPVDTALLDDSLPMDPKTIQQDPAALAQKMGKNFENNLEDRAASMTGLDQVTAPEMPNRSLVNARQQMEGYQEQAQSINARKDIKGSIQQLSQGQLTKYNQSLNNAHKSLTKYKKKYISLPSTLDLSKGVKRTSLKGKSFKERLRVGGNLHIRQGKTVDIDFSPSIAYRLNKLWSAGIEGMYRSSFGTDISFEEAFAPNTYGGRLSTDYTFFKSFYAHGELETLHRVSDTQKNVPGTPEPNIPFLSGAMAGVGKTFSMSKGVKGKVLIQYNFLHKEEYGLYNSPWVLRFGFDWTDLKKKTLGG